MSRERTVLTLCQVGVRADRRPSPVRGGCQRPAAVEGEQPRGQNARRPYVAAGLTPSWLSTAPTGVPLRTVRRRMSPLRERLIAGSLLEAGSKAAQLGLA